MESKSKKIKLILDKFIDEVLVCSEKEDCIDYFKIEIVNHNGKMQMDFQIRKRNKAY